ncbi:uncharacterized protein LOC135477623 [Liolophura sinensis]|uniref:uncharacterized protein LOC135477623 n=1 Tax=Liolophura sinensis TaxID=3198878 RepID=UPI0031584713
MYRSGTMAYHGNCCVCALTLCLCVFGSMSTSTGVCLLLSYKKFGGMSSTERTFPTGDWTKVAGIVISSAGAVMFISGILLAFCCLTTGMTPKSKEKSHNKYEIFHNDSEDQTEKKQESEKCQTERKSRTKSSGTVDVKSVSFVDCAYDVAFIEQENTGAKALQQPSPKRNDGVENNAIECVSEGETCTDLDMDREPRIEYPSVNLDASKTFPDVHRYHSVTI